MCVEGGGGRGSERERRRTGKEWVGCVCVCGKVGPAALVNDDRSGVPGRGKTSYACNGAGGGEAF